LADDFYQLYEKAQQSGNSTVNGASMKFIRLRDNDYWEDAITNVRYFGRKIFTVAEKWGFDVEYPRERSRCLLNFAIGDIEANTRGFGLYEDRELVFGYRDKDGNICLPDRDFNVMCERRVEFVRLSEGKPSKKLFIGLQFVDEIRKECTWWGFKGERQDATDLMNEYYKDALCKIPPHKNKMGHQYFLNIAKEYELSKSVEYNEGFYGNLYGKVEVLKNGVRKPAPEAKVTVSDFDQTWSAKADAKGNYEINDVILHKDCSPFNISAIYEGDWVYDQYEGPLEKPDNGHKHRKDLLIKAKKEYEGRV